MTLIPENMEQFNMEYLVWLNVIIVGVIALLGLRSGYCRYCECCSNHKSD